MSLRTDNPLAYVSWCGMKQRCTNSNTKAWDYYGGRGITVCARWLNSFAAFVEDMGERPSHAHSLERLDNDGNYEPANCAWRTMAEQAQNRKRPHRPNPSGFNVVDRGWLLNVPRFGDDHPYRTIVFHD